MKKANIILQASVCAAVIGFAGAAGAAAIPYTTADELIVTGAADPVVVTANYISASASDTDVLELYAVKNDTDPLPTVGTPLFNNKTSTSGTSLSLGNFSPGTELIFEVLVYTDSGTGTGLTGHEGTLLNTWYSGSDHTLNTDGQKVHFDPTSTTVTAGVPTTTVGIEDGTDFDYNDLVFSFTGVSTPSVPDVAGTMTMLGLGLTGLTAFGRRFRK